MSPRKPEQPTLTSQRIVAAAIALVDRDGLDALSMRRLATELGTGTMSLYYHVPSKSALYDLILDAVMDEVDLRHAHAPEPVEMRIIAAAHALRAALLAHPKAVMLALSRSLHTERQLRPVEVILGLIFEAGLTSTDAMATVNIIGQYVFGTTAAYANHMSASRYRDEAHEGDLSKVTPESFPNLSRVAREAEYAGFEGDFDRGLRALVRGLLN